MPGQLQDRAEFQRFTRGSGITWCHAHPPREAKEVTGAGRDVATEPHSADMLGTSFAFSCNCSQSPGAAPVQDNWDQDPAVASVLC